MKVTVQVVTRSDDGEESMREVACVERADLTPATLGLSLVEGKTILQAIQEVVVEWQMQEYLRQQQHCPQCGNLRHSKGHITPSFGRSLAHCLSKAPVSPIAHVSPMTPKALAHWLTCFQNTRHPSCSTWKPSGPL